MHTSLLVRLALAIPLLLSVACANTMATKPTPLKPAAADAPVVGLERDAISDLGSDTAVEYVSYDADLYDALKDVGRRHFTENAATPLVLADVALQSKFTETNWGWSLGIAMISLGLPPLGWVPLDTVMSYTVDYAVDDRAGREVLRGKATETVEGSYRGWYVARGLNMHALMDDEARFTAQNAARLIVNDLRTHNAELVAGAEHYRANPSLAPSELARVDQILDARRQRRAARRVEGKYLIDAKARKQGAPGYSAPMTAGVRAVPAAAPASRPLARKPVAVLLRPATQGAASKLQEQVLFNTMQASLSKTHRVVAGPDVERAAAGCDQIACRNAALMKLGGDHLFHASILREGDAAQLVVAVQKGVETQSRSAFCEACTTGKLDASVAKLTGELAGAMAPPPLPASPAPGMTAVAQPASTAGGAVGDAFKQCLAKKAAMQACGAVPSFGKIACRLAANAKFGSAVCP